LLLGDLLRIVQPVDIVHVLLDLLPETDGFNVEVGEAFILRVTDQVLTLCRHEFRGQPSAEQLSVEGLPPLVVIVLVRVLQLHYC